MRIIQATDRKAIERLLTRTHAADRAFDRTVAKIVDAVRDGGDPALLRFARRFDGVSPPIEVSEEEMRVQAARVPWDVRQAIRQAARNIARVAFKQIPKHFDVE